MRRRYWDADAFLGWLNDEADKLPSCRAVIEAAQRGDVEIVTSSLTLVEVLWPKGMPLQLPHERAAEVQRFFEHEWIIVYELDRKLAEDARQVVWDHGVHHKDAVHVATALNAEVEQLDTFDVDLIKLSGLVGSPPLAIGHPNLPETLF